MHADFITRFTSRHIMFAVLSFLLLLFGNAYLSHAQGSQGGSSSSENSSLESTINSILDKRLLSKTSGLSLSGYVEASYTQNFNNPATQTNQLRIFDGDANSFRPHMAQIVLEREGKTGGGLEDRAGFRVKLNFGEDAKFTGGNTGADEVDFQEAYAQYIVPVGNGLDIRIGRMNTLIGYEVIESPFNPNFSRSWLFGLGEPFTTTGIRGSYDFNEYVSFAIGGINSFTGAQADANRGKSVEALLSLTPLDWVGISLFGFWGPEGPLGASNADRVMVGGILDVQATDQAEFVVEAYYGNQANAPGLAPGANARWNGIAGYVIYDFTDQWGARIRAEIFEDAAGFFSCGGAVGVAGNANTCFAGATASQTLWETTFTLQYKPVPSLLTRLEFRYDKSDQNTFQYGTRAANNQETLAVEAIYLF